MVCLRAVRTSWQSYVWTGWAGFREIRDNAGASFVLTPTWSALLHAISYAAPTTVEDAVSILADHGSSARMLAGGTDLIVQVREKLRDTSVFVDAKQIPELMELTVDAGGAARLGAAVPCYRVYGNDVMEAQYSALVDASRIVGSTGIQGRASIGGNLCNSGPAGDTIPALIVLGAVANVAGPAGQRSIAVEDFCTGPSQNVLGEGEMLVSLTLPGIAPSTGSHYLRFIPRNEMDIAEVGAGASVTLDGDTITSARVAIGAVAPTPLLVPEAGEVMVGQIADETTYERAANAARDAATPINDMRGTVVHRKQLSFVLTQRAVRGAVDRARGMGVGNGH